VSTTLHCADKLGAHEPHEWVISPPDGHSSWCWCPGVKPGPLLDLAVNAVEHAERRLADALAALRHVSVKHRRTYDEAINAHQRHAPRRHTMSTYIIRIEPNGEVIRMDESVRDLLDVAGRALDATLDVVTMHSNGVTPFPAGGDDYLVGCVDEWGRSKGLPLNLKAWALYGRGPLVGPCFVAYDNDGAHGRPELPDAFIESVSYPVEDWLPAQYRKAMRSIANAEGVRWPL